MKIPDLKISTFLVHSLNALVLMLGVYLPGASAESMAAVVPALLAIRFDRPASDWEKEGLPIGNGAMGAVIAGRVSRDLIQFNEKTLWTGGPGAQGYDFGIPSKPQTKALAEIRAAIADKGSVTPEQAASLLGHKITAYGDYQTFGDLIIDSSLNDSDVINYRRELSLDDAQVTVSFHHKGVNYRREYFASYPDGVIAVKFSADQPGKISIATSIAVPDNRSLRLSIEKGRLTAAGQLNSNQLAYEAQVQVLPQMILSKCHARPCHFQPR